MEFLDVLTSIAQFRIAPHKNGLILQPIKPNLKCSLTFYDETDVITFDDIK